MVTKSNFDILSGAFQVDGRGMANSVILQKCVGFVKASFNGIFCFQINCLVTIQISSLYAS